MSVTRSCCRFTALSGASVQAPGRGLSERPVCTRRPTPGPRPSPALKSACCPCPLGVTAGPVLCGVRAHGEGPVGFGSRHLGARRVYFGEEVHVHLCGSFCWNFPAVRSRLQAAGAAEHGPSSKAGPPSRLRLLCLAGRSRRLSGPRCPHGAIPTSCRRGVGSITSLMARAGFSRAWLFQP